MPPYEEVGLGEMDWDADLGAYTWECPCGDLFQITPVRIPPPPPPPPPPPRSDARGPERARGNGRQRGPGLTGFHGCGRRSCWRGRISRGARAVRCIWS